MRKTVLFLMLAFFAYEPSIHAQCPQPPGGFTQPPGGFKLGRGVKGNGNLPTEGTWTYLRTNQDSVARNPHIAPDDLCDGVGGVRLSAYGHDEGDWIAIKSRATWDWIEGHPEVGSPGETLVGVFNLGGAVDGKSNLNRVWIPIEAGEDFVTAPTYWGGLSTDITQDFEIPYSAHSAWLPNESVLIQIPDGGAYLFVSPHDEYFGNTAPDGRFEILEVDCSILSVSIPDITRPVGMPVSGLSFPVDNSTSGTLPEYLDGSLTGLPPGLSGGIVNGRVVISGTPIQDGIFPVTVQVENGCRNSSDQFDMKICSASISPAPVIGEYNVHLSKAFPINSVAFTPQINASGLPAGLSATLQGDNLVISGTPTQCGDFNATVTVTGCDPVVATFPITICCAELDVVLRGNGAAIPDGSTTPQQNNGTMFPSTPIGNQSGVVYLLRNNGNCQSLNVSQVYVSPTTHFQLSNTPTGSIAAGSFAQLGLVFKPTATGTHIATVTIRSNDPDEDPYTFRVKGTGTAPSAIVFGGGQIVNPGDTSPRIADGTLYSCMTVNNSVTHEFILKNAGTAKLTVSSIGSDDGSFTVSPTSMSVLSDDMKSFFITYSPTSVGTHTATISVDSNDPNFDPYEFRVEGCATPHPHPSFDYPLVMQTPGGNWGYWAMQGRNRSGVVNGNVLLDPGATIAAVGDFTGTSDLDIVVRDGQKVSVIEFDGLGNIVATHIVSQGLAIYWTIRGAGDMDGDGNLDLVFQHIDGRLAVWYMNGATQTSSAYLHSDVQYNTLWEIRGIDDFNGDGFDDFVFEHHDGRVILWYMQDRNRIGYDSLNVNVENSVHWNIVATADTNGDGNPDLVLQHPDGRLQTYQIVNGAVTASLPLQVDLSNSRLWSIRNSGFQSMTPRFDRDNDGRNDLLYQNDDGRLVTWFMNSDLRLGTEVHAKNIEFDPGWRVAGQTDVDGDGEEDFVWQHDDGRLYIWLMHGNTFVLGAPVSHDVTSSPEWRIVGIDDINRDGLDDWIFQSTTGGGIYVWYMDGSQRLGHGSISGNNNPAWRLAAVTDMNSDSHADFIWQHTSNGNIGIWYMDGSAISQVNLFPNTVSAIWKIESVHDLDHDGHPDLVFQHQDGRQYAWYLDGITRTGTAPILAVSNDWEIRHSGD